MAKFVVPIFFLALLNSNTHAQMQTPEIEDVFTIGHFEKVKRFVLTYGNKKTYCNRYNCNPHFDFGDFEVYLNPDENRRKSADAGLSKDEAFYNSLTIVKASKYIDVRVPPTDSTLLVSGENMEDIKQQAFNYFKVMMDVTARLDSTLIEANRQATGFMICKEP